MTMYFKLKHVNHKCIYEPTFECNNKYKTNKDVFRGQRSSKVRKGK